MKRVYIPPEIWNHKMYEIDQDIFNLLYSKHPTPLSPKKILHLLDDEDYSIFHIGISLKGTLCSYVTQVKSNMWTVKKIK